jgi:hypothetical protein
MFPQKKVNSKLRESQEKFWSRVMMAVEICVQDFFLARFSLSLRQRNRRWLLRAIERGEDGFSLLSTLFIKKRH